MRITVHRVEGAIYHGETLRATWLEYRFRATPLVTDRDDGVDRMWSRSKPIRVDAPPLCRLERVELPTHPEKRPAVKPEATRLVTPFDPMGLDAAAVAHLAARGERGFRLAHAGEAAKQAVAAVPEAPEPEKQASPASAKRWGIAFASRTLPDHRTFLAASSCTPAGPIASTRDLAAVAEWSDPRHAAGWMLGRNWSPDRPVSRGLDYLYPSVAEIPAELPGWGVEFELTRGGVAREIAPEIAPQLPASNPEPAEKPARRRRELVGQLAFNF